MGIKSRVKESLALAAMVWPLCCSAHARVSSAVLSIQVPLLLLCTCNRHVTSAALLWTTGSTINTSRSTPQQNAKKGFIT